MKHGMFRYRFRAFRQILTILAAVLALGALGQCCIGQAQAQTAPPLSLGQVLYLPIYSHMYYGDNDKDGKPMQALLSAHVSIRNTDPNMAVKLLYARYYNTGGKLVREYLPAAPMLIPPLGTHEIFVPRSDTSGGSGANFMIAWSAEAPANPPLVEALHSNVQPARTVTFQTTARPINSR